MPYDTALDLQYNLQKQVANGDSPDTLLLLEHPPTITIGRRSIVADLLTDRSELMRRGIDLHEIDRGGEITGHGPGQLVIYPILDLRRHGQDLHRYLRALESVMIETLGNFEITASTKAGLTGIWVGDRKIAAIGIKVFHWVTMHGVALNISNDLTTFRRDFIPCGIRNYGVTSVSELLPNSNIRRCDIEPHFIKAFCNVFGLEPTTQNA